ncbi:MAG: hypothetical protein OXS32_10075 [Verrucomicrobiales bacterium]|nr:hypothetical protein [Verrucomicrobiales bacterium]
MAYVAADADAGSRRSLDAALAEIVDAASVGAAWAAFVKTHGRPPGSFRELARDAVAEAAWVAARERLAEILESKIEG